MKILITGASGFVATHLIAGLRATGGDDLWLTAKFAVHHSDFGVIDALDVTDGGSVAEAVCRWQPECVVNLAGVASPADARRDPKAAWDVHLRGSQNISDAILQHVPQCSLLSVGSGMVYGGNGRAGLADEQTLLDPKDEYAASKAAADMALGALANNGLRCIRLRPFNHTGPGQSESFVAPGFAMQIARIEAGLQPATIRVGNLDAIRDVLDVRDVACAYAAALRQAGDIPAGTILNISSGVGVKIGDLLEHLLALSHAKIRVERDPSRFRTTDVRSIVGDASLARQLLGWEPAYSLSETLADVLDDCRRRLRISRKQ